MKKIVTVLIWVILMITLSGCSLALEDDYYEQIEIVAEDDYYIPSKIEFKMFEGLLNNNEIDVSEYFYVDFSCPEQSVWDDCVATIIGKSIESAGKVIGIQVNTINGVEQPASKTTFINLTFYAREKSYLSLYITFVLENRIGEEKKVAQSGVEFATGVTLNGQVTGEKEDGTKYIVDYTFNYVTIDELILVTVRQFDKNDMLIEETFIDKENILDTLILNPDTDYYFVIEDYIDSDEIEYQDRIYKDAEEMFYYLYKYTNLDGFLEGDRLSITK